jgi:hypothetical protein
MECVIRPASNNDGGLQMDNYPGGGYVSYGGGWSTNNVAPAAPVSLGGYAGGGGTVAVGGGWSTDSVAPAGGVVRLW